MLTRPVVACFVVLVAAVVVAMPLTSTVPRLGNDGEYWGGIISCAGANPCNVTTSTLYGTTQFFIPADEPVSEFPMLCCTSLRFRRRDTIVEFRGLPWQSEWNHGGRERERR